MRLKIFASTAAAIGLCLSSTPAAASWCQANGNGCVLPLQGTPPVQVINTPGPVVAGEVVEEAEFNYIPFLIGAAALAAIAYFVLAEDDEDPATSP